MGFFTRGKKRFVNAFLNGKYGEANVGTPSAYPAEFVFVKE